MKEAFDLERYLSAGVENIVKSAIRATLKDPKESIFMAKYALSSKEATKKRRSAKEQGENIPPFLIASITSSCNLHCAGCYARSNHACSDDEGVSQLRKADWEKIFLEARELGIGFILLAGGEPMMRRDVIASAASIPEIIFPVFTNGTIMDDKYMSMFDQSRNLVPVISIEGHEQSTNQRRGDGVYQKVISSMNSLKKKNLTFGTSITLTTENIKEVTSDSFLHTLREAGAKVVFYVEFVPVAEETRNLAPGDAEREWLKVRLQEIREEYRDMIFISFPGDEKTSGGCLAAGRGFFHINSHGGAEPCPFSPYSDINVKDTSLKEAIYSKLFQKLQNQDVLMEEHAGGCVLFEKKEQVEALL
ncbi:radical SAM protein [Novisyntrophococcus fermenticellae]|uniref:radical SAM protein n=1 Tax=Novisyntrophococcus fermenticellae TaxID=2068655 RepID=UPI001E4996E0|nr:radical SAM protein [Novisyntrophococcus fermenticellae]